MKNYIIKSFCISFIIFALIFTTGCVNNENLINATTTVTETSILQAEETAASEDKYETSIDKIASDETSQAVETLQTTAETAVQETTQTTTQEQTTVTTTTEPPQTEPEVNGNYKYDLSKICVKNLFGSVELPKTIATAKDVVDLRVYAEITGKAEIQTYTSTFEEITLAHIYSDGLINEFEIMYVDKSQPINCSIVFSEEYKIFQAIRSKNTSILTSKEIDVYNKVYEIINSIVDINDSNYNNAKVLHDYIINTTRYVNTDDDKSSYGALINGQAVCTGYSEAYWLLCNASGIPCHIITGIGGGENHQWNIFYANGKWLYTDVTWDDPISANADNLTYDYFASEEKLENHTYDDIDLRLK